LTGENLRIFCRLVDRDSRCVVCTNFVGLVQSLLTGTCSPEEAMVFFTCNGCGEAVKKQQVEKHRLRCRRSHVFSCMDCGTEFRGIEYNGHIKCITEQEKYSGGTYQEKERKGEAKQESWIDQVQKAIDQAKPTNIGLRNLLESLKSYTNIPRKQAKFKNFLSSSLRVRDERLIDDAWAAISASSKEDTEPSDGQNKQHIDSQSTEREASNKRPLQEGVETASEKKRQKVEEKNEQEEEQPATVEANGHSGKKSKKEKSKKSLSNSLSLPNDESLTTFTNAKNDEEPSDDHNKEHKKNKSSEQEMTNKRRLQEVETMTEKKSQQIEENNEHKENLAVIEASGGPRKLKKKMFKAAVKSILTETAEGRMKLKKLRKAVVKTLSTDNVSEEDVLACIDDLLPKCKQFVVEGKYISIAS
ncbi:hypothetical protein M514_03022, partial [Trichuris suis]